MNEKELAQFVKWLPSNINEFKDKTPEEVVTILNKLSQTEEGMNTISGFINQFKQSSQMFKKGGKLDFLINNFQASTKIKVIDKDQNNSSNWFISKFTEYSPIKNKK